MAAVVVAAAAAEESMDADDAGVELGNPSLGGDVARTMASEHKPAVEEVAAVAGAGHHNCFQDQTGDAGADKASDVEAQAGHGARDSSLTEAAGLSDHQYRGSCTGGGTAGCANEAAAVDSPCGDQDAVDGTVADAGGTESTCIDAEVLYGRPCAAAAEICAAGADGVPTEILGTEEALDARRPFRPDGCAAAASSSGNDRKRRDCDADGDSDRAGELAGTQSVSAAQVGGALDAAVARPG